MRHTRFKKMLATRRTLSSRDEERIREHLGGCDECQRLEAVYARQAERVRMGMLARSAAALAGHGSSARRQRVVPGPPPGERSILRVAILAAVSGALAVGASSPLTMAIAGRIRNELVAARPSNPCAVPRHVIWLNGAGRASPQEYAARGGYMFAGALRRAERTPNVLYVVVRGAGLQELSCGPARVEVAMEVGINLKADTRLLAISWLPETKVQIHYGVDGVSSNSR